MNGNGFHANVCSYRSCAAMDSQILAALMDALIETGSILGKPTDAYASFRSRLMPKTMEVRS